jgi:hypothetical protein
VTAVPGYDPASGEALRVRVLRRLGLPDDGRLWLSDAISPDVLRGYHGVITSETRECLMIDFVSLSDAVSWAETITETGRDRQMVALSTQPWSPYQPVTILVLMTPAGEISGRPETTDLESR